MSVFRTAGTEGGLLSAQLPQSVVEGDGQLEGLMLSDYYLAACERLNEAITRSWNPLLRAWRGVPYESPLDLPPGPPAAAHGAVV